MKLKAKKHIAMILLLITSSMLLLIGLLVPLKAQDNTLDIDYVMFKQMEPSSVSNYGMVLTGDLATVNPTITLDETYHNILHIQLPMPSSLSNENKLQFVTNLNKNGVVSESKQKFDAFDNNTMLALTSNITFNNNDLKKAEQGSKIVVFQGSGLGNNVSGFDTKLYFVTEKDNQNLFLVFANTLGTYNSNLGVYYWGIENAPSWGDKGKEFSVSSSYNEKSILVSMFSSSDLSGLGMIVYTGVDGKKYTGDIKGNKYVATAEQFSKSPKYCIDYVTDIGNNEDTSKNVYSMDKIDDFYESSFNFKFVNMQKDEQYILSGTYALNKKTVMVETSLPFNYADEVKDVTQDVINARKAQLLKDITINEVTLKNNEVKSKGSNVAIKDILIDYNLSSLTKFVIQLDTELDNTKDYQIEFNNHKEGSLSQQATSILNVVKKLPTITIDDLNIENNTIQIKLNTTKEELLSKVPQFTVKDERDNPEILKQAIYVPSFSEGNENNYVFTSKVGKYPVKFVVTDSFGNTGELVVTFEVVQ